MIGEAWVESSKNGVEASTVMKIKPEYRHLFATPINDVSITKQGETTDG